MSYHKLGFIYSSSFLIADLEEAWVLETAGNVWAAARAAGVRSISNGLTLGAALELVDDAAVKLARERGWCRGREAFDFTKCFSDPLLTAFAGASIRSACTAASAARAQGALSLAVLAAGLRDHAGHPPTAGFRMLMPCAHAAPWPTRTSGQTTGSMVAHLGARPSAWATGTSSPCLSAFKPIPIATGATLDAGPSPGGRPDGESLWWRHERLHRATLASYAERATLVQARIAALEADASDAPDVWERHRTALPEWLREVEGVGRERRSLSQHWYWRRMERLESLASAD